MPFTIEYSSGVSLICSTALTIEQLPNLAYQEFTYKQAVSLLDGFGWPLHGEGNERKAPQVIGDEDR